MKYLLAAIAGGLIVLLAGHSCKAHQAPTGWWYDGACCSVQDCRQALAGEVVANPDGSFTIPSMGITLPYSDPKRRDSKDEFYHLCIVAGAVEGYVSAAKLRCLYTPTRGM